ncbi:hypothetical protein EYF80_019808 [Liparis tanakae]|uniref:Uncharacterized protein n=1 Tax=Liparis tanakae TaxID=230148 RepID=A0A4Z2HX74_9TELE|nr:hypothetical protein EYF80_019808 [Liparis tanakae]
MSPPGSAERPPLIRDESVHLSGRAHHICNPERKQRETSRRRHRRGGRRGGDELVVVTEGNRRCPSGPAASPRPGAVLTELSVVLTEPGRLQHKPPLFLEHRKA